MVFNAMVETKIIIEGIVSVLLIGRGVMSHFEHKRAMKQNKQDALEIKIYLNGEFEKRLAEERKKWEEEIKNER